MPQQEYRFMADGGHDRGCVDHENDRPKVVLNRARLYHDRRDCYIHDGNAEMQDDDSVPHSWMKRDEARSTSDDDN